MERNAYGRQIDSRIARITLENGGGELEAVFIRALHHPPGWPDAIVPSYNGDPVWVEQGRHMVTTFRPG